MGKGKWGSGRKPEAEEKLTPAETEEAASQIAEIKADEALAAEPDPVPADLEPTPAEPTFPKPVFNAEKMRKACAGCGCTQLIVTIVRDETSKRKGWTYTCNDCKKVHKE